MDQRTQTMAGGGMLLVSSIVVLLYAIPEFDWIPGLVAFVAALVMAGGTLLLGVSDGGV
ncbi:hypothetical protein [Halococcus hamelinensis]|uniref:hypothetical protein n=1 Tax=Halococcus hamelinensis TaxID=332168 RepID=UPI000B22BD25|nr:hypothetical protein [Halococcus hamelinensis]